MTDPITPPPGTILAPSHVTRAQAVVILGQPKQTVYTKAVKGGPLETEDWWGTALIPMFRVMQELNKHPKETR